MYFLQSKNLFLKIVYFVTVVFVLQGVYMQKNQPWIQSRQELAQLKTKGYHFYDNSEQYYFYKLLSYLIRCNNGVRFMACRQRCAALPKIHEGIVSWESTRKHWQTLTLMLARM